MQILQTMSLNKKFTLIEMIAVIAIISVASALTVSTFREESPVRKLQRTGLEFESFCAGVRYQAMEHAEERIILLDSSNSRLLMKTPEMMDPEMEREEPEEIRTFWNFPEEFQLESPDMNFDETVELFRFFPDGGAAGLREIVFQYRNLKRKYHVSPLTGRLLLQEDEE